MDLGDFGLYEFGVRVGFGVVGGEDVVGFFETVVGDEPAGRFGEETARIYQSVCYVIYIHMIVLHGFYRASLTGSLRRGKRRDLQDKAHLQETRT